MKRDLIPFFVLSAVSWMPACETNESPSGVSDSVLTAEFPHDGAWEVVGQKPVVFSEGYENNPLPLDQLELAETDNPEHVMQRDPDEGDQPVFVADDGHLYLRTDRVIDLSALREPRPYFPAGTELNAGETEGDVEKDIYGDDDRVWWSDTTSYP